MTAVSASRSTPPAAIHTLRDGDLEVFRAIVQQQPSVQTSLQKLEATSNGPSVGNEPARVVQARFALSAIAADSYATWQVVCAAIANEFGEDIGKPLAKDWSAKSDKFDEDEFEKKWTSFRKAPQNGKDRPTLGKIIWLADQVPNSGWRQRWEAATSVEVGTRDPASGRMVLDPKRTQFTVEAFVRERCQHDEGRTLHCYAGQFWQWKGNCYEPVEDAQPRHALHLLLHDALRRSPKGKLVPFEANPATVNAAFATLGDHVRLPASMPVPCWLNERPDDLPVKELLVGKTCSLHIPTGKVLQATPRLFVNGALAFDYDGNAEWPTRWELLLLELFGEDQQAVGLLQEWFGYCLVGDTSQQKALLIVGPRRSGKGTIARVLRELIGATNVVGPTTSSLAGNFGLQQLIGKSLAIVSDARFAGADVQTLVERLLCVTGEDALTIDRKFMDAVTMRLPTRFLFLTNELPMFRDASAALAGRFLVLRLTKSFFGQEDSTLTEKLLEELPGILLWAIEGWKRLRDRKRFQEPASSRAAVEQLADLASPVAAFVRERCVVGAGHRVSAADLYSAYRLWCTNAGIKDPPPLPRFGRDMAAAMPDLKVRQGTRGRFYDGLALVVEAEHPSRGFAAVEPMRQLPEASS